MVAPNLHAIAKELNQRAREHPIGALQNIRSDLNHRQQTGQDIFRLGSKTVRDDWACHYGGRRELQFNIGLEETGQELRHGVAFSLEPSRELPNIAEILAPKVQLFNDFMVLCPKLFADMGMWHYDHGDRSRNYMPGPIPPELVREHVFIFLGKWQHIDRIDYEAVLNDFDLLLPLYEYVESNGALQPTLLSPNADFAFHSGCSVKASSATATQVEKQLNVRLRHNDLQTAFHRELVSRFGAENVGTEIPSGVSTSVDIVVRREDAYWFYEIKTSRFPRACLREAVGQLLEYAFWPGAQEAKRLIVVGESPIDKDATEYLCRLKERFSLPIEYEQVTLIGEQDHD